MVIGWSVARILLRILQLFFIAMVMSVTDSVVDGGLIRKQGLTNTVPCTQPEVVPRCIHFWVSAYKLYPFRVQDSVLNMTAQEQPFIFALPTELPVTSGNSGDYLATITVDAATVVTSSGNALAVGRTIPQFPDEIAAAQSYAFEKCLPEDLGLVKGVHYLII